LRYLFSGTRGAANSPYRRSAEGKLSRVKEWADREAGKLQAKSSNRRWNFNTASIVYDNGSGQSINQALKAMGSAFFPALGSNES